MEETEAARAIDDIAKSSGINKIIGDDATKPAIPNKHKIFLTWSPNNRCCWIGLSRKILN
jgi:hypothetical protein